jgi:integrase
LTFLGKSVKIAFHTGKRHGMHVVALQTARQLAYLTKEEAAVIRREHVAERIWITRIKGGVSGEYPIHPITRRLLWEYLGQREAAGGPYLFTRMRPPRTYRRIDGTRTFCGTRSPCIS